MTEQNLTDTPITVETPPVNSFIRRSISNKLDVITIPSLPTSTDEDMDKCASISDSDSDSFDDENDTIVPDSFYSSLSAASSNTSLMSCPICLELAILQSASCCKFRCCHSCWRAHVSFTINDGRIKMPCASSECNRYLSRETIVSFIRLDPTLHDRYLKLYANANQNPRAKTCPRCSHLYSLDRQSFVRLPDSKKFYKKLPKQVQCSECSLVWCFRCSAPWHENLTCKQFIKGDKLLLKWINQKNEEQWNARKCPKCSSVIQRAGGCPHMTCSSCSCEFCYLCGRRYLKIPIIGQHNNKFSMLGCPYNLHPEKPWLRRTIRGVIATGIFVASPLIVVGAAAAAVTVLPSVGIYRFVKRVRTRRNVRAAAHELIAGPDDGFDPDQEQIDNLFGFDIHGEEFDREDILRILRQLNLADDIQTPNDDFPLSIFADMDVENLFVEDERPISDFRTCPTTPAITDRETH